MKYCSNIGSTRDYHAKCSKSERERQIPYDITYIWNLKYNICELVYETKVETHRHRKQTYGYLRGKGVEEGPIKSLGLIDTNYCM